MSYDLNFWKYKEHTVMIIKKYMIRLVVMVRSLKHWKIFR